MRPSLKKWVDLLEKKRVELTTPRQTSAQGMGQLAGANFPWMNQVAPQNPYRDEADEYDEQDTAGYGQSSFSTSRNASSTSLRSRSTTGESTRAPPPRFPMGAPQVPPLATHFASDGANSASYQRSVFSPVDTPNPNSRTNSATGFNFPPQYRAGDREDPNNRYTAPAMGRTPSRESQSAVTSSRPSMQAYPHGAQHAAMTQNRGRSASSPDIPGVPNQRRPNGQSSQPPVPPVPYQHMTNGHPGYNRSHTTSPVLPPNQLPIRSATQSPGVQRERLNGQNNGYSNGRDTYSGGKLIYGSETLVQMQSYTSQPSRPQMQQTQSAYVSSNANSSVAPSMPATWADPVPTNDSFKTRVKYKDSTFLLIVKPGTTFETLAFRIDQKVQRMNPVGQPSLIKGSLRLHYQDEDGDKVLIATDEDMENLVASMSAPGVGK